MKTPGRPWKMKIVRAREQIVKKRAENKRVGQAGESARARGDEIVTGNQVRWARKDQQETSQVGRESHASSEEPQVAAGVKCQAWKQSDMWVKPTGQPRQTESFSFSSSIPQK